MPILANGLGNLASRTLTMIARYFKGEIPYPSRAGSRAEESVIADTARQTIAEFNSLFEQRQFSRALEVAWGLVAAVDKYIVENQPWALGEKQDDESRSQLATTLYTSAEALRIVTALAHPIIPDATAKIWTQLGLGDIRKFDLCRFEVGTTSPWHETRGRTAGISPRRQERNRKDAADGRARCGLPLQLSQRKRKK